MFVPRIIWRDEMNVRQLIAELIKLDMESNVFIGIGENESPDGASHLHSVGDYRTILPRNASRKCQYGVYIIPADPLIDGDA